MYKKFWTKIFVLDIYIFYVVGTPKCSECTFSSIIRNLVDLHCYQLEYSLETCFSHLDTQARRSTRERSSTLADYQHFSVSARCSGCDHIRNPCGVTIEALKYIWD